MPGVPPVPDNLPVDRRWYAADLARLRFEPIDALTLVYDRASGQTHLLASPLPEILECLTDSPVTTADLVIRLTATFDLSDSNPVPIVGERLAELSAMGLVEAR